MVRHKKWYVNNVHFDACACIHRQEASANAHNRKSVSEWEGGQAEEQVLWWRQIWLLSTSAFLNTRSYLPSPLEERSFLFSFLLLPVLHLSLALISAQPSLQTHLSRSHLSLYTSLIFQFFFFFCQESLACYFHFHSALLLTIPSFLFLLSMEQPIQQQNKAAWSITRWLIKQDQNSAAVRPTLQNQDTGKRWSGEVEEKKPEEDKYSKSNDAY